MRGQGGDKPRLFGVDGCPAGWIVVSASLFSDGFRDLKIEIFPAFDVLLGMAGPGAIISVDMPIGLPERIEGSGRGPEQAVRPHLGARQSSVFSIPSRRAVYADDYGQACAIALETSEPPKKVSKQAFNIFPKIREIDTALRMRGDAGMVYETHPELAFWSLNGSQAMQLPKKIKSRVNPAGMAERKALLANHGFDAEFLETRPPRGSAADDFLDACACLAIAARISRGLAKPFPENFERDAHGLPIAIWA
jgi:predicted RNase H-like nuclease